MSRAVKLAEIDMPDDVVEISQVTEPNVRRFCAERGKILPGDIILDVAASASRVKIQVFENPDTDDFPGVPAPV